MNHDVINAVCAAVVLGEGENYEPVHLEPREARQAIIAYLSATGAADRERLIGNLLDRWEMTPNDLKAEMREHGCGKQLDALMVHVESSTPTPAIRALKVEEPRG
jgi:shikimate kinase